MSTLQIKRVLTANLTNPYEKVEFKTARSTLRNADGSVAAVSQDLLVPAHWSDIAVDVLARNYFRKGGVAKFLKRMPEAGIPTWLERSEPEARADQVFGEETDARKLFDRLAGGWTYWGVKGNYFATPEDALNFFDEMRYMLVMQMAAPNSPQWFNTGIYWAYGIKGDAQGHYYFDEVAQCLQRSTSAYERPQPHACFIQSIKDDLVNEGGIMDLWKNEARLFKYGSGTGTNFSSIRGAGEPLSGGGFSSGLMSFLRIGDVAGGSIKSGGTTRRAAKMVILNVDHPDIENFINWKAGEEGKVIDLVVGSKVLKKYTDAIIESYNDKTKLKEALQDALANEIPEAYLLRLLAMLKEGVSVEKVVHRLDWDSGVYSSVFGQSSNNSVRVTNEFLQAVKNDGDYALRWRTDGTACKTLKARYLWEAIAKASWSCADPGVQFDDTINEWHTCLNDGRINGSNPCSEYMFLDDTACNLASINLLKFLKQGDATYNSRFVFDIENFKHATRLWTLTLEISVYMAQFPTAKIAKLSYDYRTLGLGYGNLGALLLQVSLPYDSDEGRNTVAGITALMHGVAYETSAEIAQCMGAFARFEANRSSMLRVIRNHAIAAYGAKIKQDVFHPATHTVAGNHSITSGIYASSQGANHENGFKVGFAATLPSYAEYENLTIKPVPFDKSFCMFSGLADEVERTWYNVLDKGSKYGFRNAQVTCIAPTGTIGMVMDFDTTGVEPYFSQVRLKQLAGGGVWKLVNKGTEQALRTLGYSEAQIQDIKQYVLGHGNLDGGIALNTQWLMSKGFLYSDIEKLNLVLANTFDIKQAFNKHILGEETLQRLGFKEDQYNDADFDMLHALGANESQINEANVYCCGNFTLEGAPHLSEEHLPTFDCARPSGNGVRALSYQAHIRMMAAVQPFMSGAISKTVNMPNEVTIKDFEETHMFAYEQGLKSVAMYREGSKYSQVLTTGRKEKLFDFDDDDDVMIDKEAESIADDAVVAASSEESVHASHTEKEQSQNKAHQTMKQVDDVFKPFRRRGYTQHVLIGGSGLWHTTGEDEAGKLSNLLLTYGKEGSTLRGWASAWGRILSMYLQERGDRALLRVYKAFRHSKFEPMGEVQGHPYIKYATSVPDYIVEDLVVAYPDMLNANPSHNSLPPQRNGKINKIKIGEETMYIIIGEDQEGRPAEIFVAGIGNEGSDLKGWMSSCAKLISLYFQDCGDAAVWQFIHAFEGSSFEPAGLVTGHGAIKFATSPLDFLAKHLRLQYGHVLSNEQLKLEIQPEKEPVLEQTFQQASCQERPARVEKEAKSCRIASNDMEIQIRSLSGYKVDEPCKSCRAFKLRYNGTCYICDNCFTTTGCS